MIDEKTKIAIGCDEAAYAMKEILKKHLNDQGYETTDCGVYDENAVLYPDIAAKVCKEIQSGRCQRGVLVCGTGIGMAMTANKFKGIRAAVVHDPFSAERSIKSNNAQVCCMGARIIAPQLAMQLLDIWMSCEFKDGPSTPKIERISYYEEQEK